MEGHAGKNEENCNLFHYLFLLILPPNTAISQEIFRTKIISPGHLHFGPRPKFPRFFDWKASLIWMTSLCLFKAVFIHAAVVPKLLIPYIANTSVNDKVEHPKVVQLCQPQT